MRLRKDGHKDAVNMELTSPLPFRVGKGKKFRI